MSLIFASNFPQTKTTSVSKTDIALQGFTQGNTFTQQDIQQSVSSFLDASRANQQDGNIASNRRRLTQTPQINALTTVVSGPDNNMIATPPSSSLPSSSTDMAFQFQIGLGSNQPPRETFGRANADENPTANWILRFHKQSDDANLDLHSPINPQAPSASLTAFKGPLVPSASTRQMPN
jgi:hypothetical protein